MKTIFNTLAIIILVNFSSYSQTDINQDTLLKSVINALNAIEPTVIYADHSHLSEKLLNLVLNHQDDEIFDIIHTQGFNNFTKIVYENEISITNEIITSDSLISIELNEIRSIFPKKVLATSPKINSYTLFGNTMTSNTWYFTSSKNIQYKFSAYYIDNQITSIGYKIFK
jgi:hypothetical protein